MDLDPTEWGKLHWGLVLGLVSIFLVWERLTPFRIPIQSKLEHVSTNFIIFGGNSVVSQFIASWTVFLWSDTVQREAWGLLVILRPDPLTHVLASVVLLDLLGYGLHRLYHRVPFLWRLHRAHHSDLDMDATTSVRFHLAEVLLTTGIKGLSVALLGILPMGFFLSEMLTFAAGLFSHGNVKLPSWLEPRLRMALVTPTMHWIHHSHLPADHHTNLGAVFSGWDRLFGTYSMGIQSDHLTFGLDEYLAPADVTIVRFCRIPFDPPCRRLEP